MARQQKQFIIVATLTTTGERKPICPPTTRERAEDAAEKLRFCMRVTPKKYKVYRHIRVKEIRPRKMKPYVVMACLHSGGKIQITVPQSRARCCAAAARLRQDIIMFPHLDEYNRFKSFKVVKLRT